MGCLLVALLAGCGLVSGDDHGAASSGGPSTAPSSTAPGAPSASASRYQPTDADFAAIRRLMGRRAQSLLHGDRQAFLATVDTSQPDLVHQQEIFYANVEALPVKRLYYGVGNDGLVPDPVPGNDPVLRPEMYEHLQITGTYSKPMTNAVVCTFVKRDGHWLLGAESQPGSEDDYGASSDRPWFGTRIAVVHDPTYGFTVVADATDRDQLPGYRATIHDDIGEDARLLGVPADYHVLVDATTNGVSHTFSDTNGEQAGAVTKGVYASNRMATEGRGRAGTVIKINPHMVQRMMADPGTLKHELTHYLLDRYNGASPEWLVEGIATYVQYYPDDFSQLQVPAALYDKLQARDHEIPASGLFGIDPDTDYPIAQAIVTALVDDHGMARLIDLMKLYRSHYQGADVDALTPRLLRQEYGTTPRAVATRAWQLLSSFQH